MLLDNVEVSRPLAPVQGVYKYNNVFGPEKYKHGNINQTAAYSHLTPAVLSKTNLKLVDNTKTKHMELSILFD
jgi:hypothetical protein